MDINNLIGDDKYFKWIEQIKDIRYINEEFSYENGFLTKKYSIKRNKIYEVYKKLIDEMYQWNNLEDNRGNNDSRANIKRIGTNFQEYFKK